MMCPICNEVELQGKQKYCSESCKQKAKRNRVTPNVSHDTVKPSVTPQKPTVSHCTQKHWFGKAPHKPIWVADCDCPKILDYTPTYTRPCCSVYSSYDELVR